MNDELVSRIHGVRFTPVRFRQGYDMGAVDDLLDRLAQAASEGRPLGELVAAAVFPVVRLREGYEMGDVDRFLAELGGSGASR